MLICFYRISQMEFPIACLKILVVRITRYLQLEMQLFPRLYVRKVKQPFHKVPPYIKVYFFSVKTQSRN